MPTVIRADALDDLQLLKSSKIILHTIFRNPNARTYGNLTARCRWMLFQIRYDFHLRFGHFGMARI